MHTIVRLLHLFALALWFGSIVFFSFFTALPVIRHMEKLAESRPDWLLGLIEKKQGTRLAGEALSAVFDSYFILQLICAVVALFTAGRAVRNVRVWTKQAGIRELVRQGILLSALALVICNLALFAPRVHELRTQRYQTNQEMAEKADADFGRWHAYSLVTDMITLILVAAALGLSITLPQQTAKNPVAHSSGHSPENTSTAGPVM